MKKICVIMGSKSDELKVKPLINYLEDSKLCHYEIRVASAHRSPELVIDIMQNSTADVFIGAAGMSAGLPGLMAAYTTKPVIGLPLSSSNSSAVNGMDSVLSMLQLPPGVPVATVALDGARNAGNLALRILSLQDKKIAQWLLDEQEVMFENVAKDATLI